MPRASRTAANTRHADAMPNSSSSSGSASLAPYHWLDRLTSPPSRKLLHWLYQYAAEAKLDATLAEVAALLEARCTADQWESKRAEIRVRQHLRDAALWLNINDATLAPRADDDESDELHQTLESGIDALRVAAVEAGRSPTDPALVTLHVALLTVAALQAARRVVSASKFANILESLFKSAAKDVDDEQYGDALRERRSLCTHFWDVEHGTKKAGAEKEKQRAKSRSLIEQCDPSTIREELNHFLTSLAREQRLYPATLTALEEQWDAHPDWRPDVLLAAYSAYTDTELATATAASSHRSRMHTAAANQALEDAADKLKRRGRDPLSASLKHARTVVQEDDGGEHMAVEHDDDADGSSVEVKQDAEVEEEEVEEEEAPRPTRRVRRKSTPPDARSAKRQKRQAKKLIEEPEVEEEAQSEDASAEANNEANDEGTEVEVETESDTEVEPPNKRARGRPAKAKNARAKKGARHGEAEEMTDVIREYANGRRVRVPWNAAEVRYLRRGVTEFKDDRNKWSQIYIKYREHFQPSRIPTDLKDKWRVENKPKKQTGPGRPRKSASNE